MNTLPDDMPPARFVGVGIGTYKDKRYPPLPGAPVEAREIAELLGSRGVQVRILAARTEAGLFKELRRALPPRRQGGGGQLVLLWAGHGDQLSDAPVRLVAGDTAKDDAPLLTPEHVASVAVRTGATQVLLIFDTCFSGGADLPVLARADKWFSEQEGPPGKVWLGVLASAMDWQKARDDLFGPRLARLLREGPATEELRLRGWSAHNARIRGDDLIDALQKEWPEEAATLYRDLAAANPAYLPDLAAALNNLGTCYSDVGRRADAIAPTEEAATLYRDLAAANPGYLPDLAAALNNLGIRYSEVGRRADAIAPTEEAATLRRDLECSRFFGHQIQAAN